MYQVLARKYRPQSFKKGLIGQQHVRTTLENAISQGRIAHGYIFAGQRGTGKTTVARILALCLNCVDGPTAQPCGKCPSCFSDLGRKPGWGIAALRIRERVAKAEVALQAASSALSGHTGETYANEATVAAFVRDKVLPAAKELRQAKAAFRHHISEREA